MMMGPTAVGRLAGVLCYRCGQTNVLGRYAFHWHLIGQANSSYGTDLAVWRSFYRCYTLHAVQYVKLHANVAYDARGFCVYLEEGA